MLLFTDTLLELGKVLTAESREAVSQRRQNLHEHPQAGFLKVTHRPPGPLNSTDGVHWAQDQATIRTTTLALFLQDGRSAHGGDGDSNRETS